MTRKKPQPLSLLPQHARLIKASSIALDVMSARGYRSVSIQAELGRLGFAPSQRLVPTLVIPIHNVRGEVCSYQHRPDTPRMVRGKLLKYETPKDSRMLLDVPPQARRQRARPLPLLLTSEVSARF